MSQKQRKLSINPTLSQIENFGNTPSNTNTTPLNNITHNSARAQSVESQQKFTPTNIKITSKVEKIRSQPLIHERQQSPTQNRKLSSLSLAAEDENYQFAKENFHLELENQQRKIAPIDISNLQSTSIPQGLVHPIYFPPDDDQRKMTEEEKLIQEHLNRSAIDFQTIPPLQEMLLDDDDQGKVGRSTDFNQKEGNKIKKNSSSKKKQKRYSTSLDSSNVDRLLVNQSVQPSRNFNAKSTTAFKTPAPVGGNISETPSLDLSYHLPIAYKFYRKLKLKHIYKSLSNDIAKHMFKHSKYIGQSQALQNNKGLQPEIRSNNRGISDHALDQYRRNLVNQFSKKPSGSLRQLQKLADQQKLHHHQNHHQSRNNEDSLKYRSGSWANVGGGRLIGGVTRYSTLTHLNRTSQDTQHQNSSKKISNTTSFFNTLPGKGQIYYYTPMTINSTSESTESAFKEILDHFKRAMTEVAEQQVSKTASVLGEGENANDSSGSENNNQKNNGSLANRVMRETIMSALTAAAGNSVIDSQQEEDGVLLGETSTIIGNKHGKTRTVFSRKGSANDQQQPKREQDYKSSITGDDLLITKSMQERQNRNYGNVPFKPHKKLPQPSKIHPYNHLPQNDQLNKNKRNKLKQGLTSAVKPQIQNQQPVEIITGKTIPTSQQQQQQQLPQSPSLKLVGDKLATKIPTAKQQSRVVIHSNRTGFPGSITQEDISTNRQMAMQSTRYKQKKTPNKKRASSRNENLPIKNSTQGLNYSSNDQDQLRNNILRQSDVRSSSIGGVSPFGGGTMNSSKFGALHNQQLTSVYYKKRGDEQAYQTTQSITKHVDALKKGGVNIISDLRDKTLNDSTFLLTKSPEHRDQKKISSIIVEQIQHIPRKASSSIIDSQKQQHKERRSISSQQNQEEIATPKNISIIPTKKPSSEQQSQDPQIKIISDIYDHFTIHKPPVKPVANLFRQQYKKHKHVRVKSMYNDEPYISRAEDIHNRLATDKYYVLRHENNKQKYLNTIWKKFEERNFNFEEKNPESDISTDDTKNSNRQGYSVHTLSPPDSNRLQLIKKMGHFSIVAPTQSPFDLSNPHICFQQYSQRYMALGGNSQFSSNLSKSLIQPDRFNRFSHLYRFESDNQDGDDEEIDKQFHTYNMRQQQFTDAQLDEEEFQSSSKAQITNNINMTTQGSNQQIEVTANFPRTTQLSQEDLLLRQRVQSVPIQEKLSERRKFCNYSQLDKSMMKVQNNQRLLQIRQKLRQARPLMNVQFTNHVLSRAPFTTMDQLNTLQNEQQQLQKKQQKADSFQKFKSKRWLLYDKNPQKLPRKSFYMNVLDKSSNFILPKVTPTKRSESKIENKSTKQSIISQKMSRNYHHSIDQSSQHSGIKNVQVIKPPRLAPKNPLKQRKISKVQSLRSGLQAGYFRPVRLNPSIQSPMPHSLLTSNQRGSLLSLNLHGGSLIQTREASVIGSNFDEIIPVMTGGGKLNSIDTNTTRSLLNKSKQKRLDLQIMTPGLPQNIKPEMISNLRSPLHVNPLAGKQIVDPQIVEMMNRL